MLAGLTPFAPAQIVLGEGALPPDLEEPAHEGALGGRAVEEGPRLRRPCGASPLRASSRNRLKRASGSGAQRDARPPARCAPPPGRARARGRSPAARGEASPAGQEADEPEGLAVTPGQGDPLLEVLASLADPTQVDLGVAREHEGHEGGEAVARLGGEGEGFLEARLGARRTRLRQ